MKRHRQVEKLLLLKKLHPDLFLPDELKEAESAIEKLSPKEFDGFVKTINLEDFIRALKKISLGLSRFWREHGSITGEGSG